MSDHRLVAPPLPSDDPETPALNAFMANPNPAAFEAFHLKAAEVMERAQRAGHYDALAMIGGRLMAARIEAGGISVRQSYTFSEAAVNGAQEGAQHEAPAPARQPATR